MSTSQPITTAPNLQPTPIPTSIHLRHLQTLLLRGYTSQLLFTSQLTQLPPTLKIPALISCRMYQQATIQILKDDNIQNQPLHLLWLIICSHMIGMSYDEYYQKLTKQKQQKYKQLADDWIKMNKPLQHQLQIKLMLRKRFQQILQKSQQQQYYTTPKMPVFLISCLWLQKFYNNNLTFIPAVDNSNLYQPMPYIQTDPNYIHYNYKLKQQYRQNIHYKIISYEAWQYLFTNFGGMQFRRFTTNQKQPICQLNYQKIKIVIVQDRYLFGLRVFEILVGRYDTIASIVERIKRIMVSYGVIQFQSLKLNWEPVLISHLGFQELVEILQDQERDLIKQSSLNNNNGNGNNKYQLSRLQFNHDIQDSQYNYSTDILLFNLTKSSTSTQNFIDIHSIPYKKTIKKYNKCLTCNTTQRLDQCQCKQVYFCCKQCRNKNKQHLKICDNLMKQDSIIQRLIDTYSVNKRKYKFSDIKNNGKVGLQNLGNTCYMNSALQCVLSIQCLNQYFCQNLHIKQINVSNVLGSNGNLVCAYGEFIKDYYTTNRRSLQPIKILKIISSKNAQFRGHNHQDSQQFFNYFFDKLHQDLNRVRDKPYVENIESDGRPDQIISQLSWRNYLKRNSSFISDNFAGQYRSEIRCPDCQRISITFDPFLSVTLQFPKQQSLEQLVGYYLSQQGGFQKIQRAVKGSMIGQQFLQKYFNEPVYALWLRKKQPEAQWKLKKSVSFNNGGRGALIFYPKPVQSTVQLQVKYQGFDIFHRKIFTTQIESQQKLLQILYKHTKIPILKATKNQQILKMNNQQYLNLCKQNEFLQIVSNSVKQYPITVGTFQIKLKILENKLPWQLIDKIKFDITSKPYIPRADFKPPRSIQDKISVSQLIQSFSQPEQLTQQNSWYCNKCKQHKLAQKIMSIYKTSKYLVIHLKRFNHRGNRFVIYGEKVRMPINLNQIQIINGLKYQLFGVVNHYGNLVMGHYTAYVKRQKQWFYADDSSFKRRDVQGSQAYLLFYKRVQ